MDREDEDGCDMTDDAANMVMEAAEKADNAAKVAMDASKKARVPDHLFQDPGF